MRSPRLLVCFAHTNAFRTPILAVWVAFWVLWLAGASRAKPGTVRPWRIRLALLLPLVAAGVVMRLALRRQESLGGLPVHLAGSVLFALGIALAVWARFVLGRNWGMPMTAKDEPELITAGPYRYVRHPIYSGIMLAALGSGLAADVSWFAFLVIMGAYFIYSAVQEEKLLTQRFPREYPTYRARTRMLIPYVF